MHGKTFPFFVRQARMDDVPALEALVADSMRGLGAPHYSPEQIESALQHLIGIDTQLIEDGTYYVVETDDGEIAGAGGWSCRSKLYGAGHAEKQPSTLSDAPIRVAVIRAFFVHPNWARRGVGTRLLRTCEMVTRRAGYHRLELAATLAGLPLYLKCGFVPAEELAIDMPDHNVFPGMKMFKNLSMPYPPARQRANHQGAARR